MTHEDQEHYGKKHSPDREIKPTVADALKKQVSDGEISCAAAHKLSIDLNETPEELGFTMDILEMRIAKCRLGLFGYKPDTKVVQPAMQVSKLLEGYIKNMLENNKLPCKAAWAIAEKLDLKKMSVASACETLKMKISPCQLGAF